MYVVNLSNTIKWSERINNWGISVDFGLERGLVRENKSVKE